MTGQRSGRLSNLLPKSGFVRNVGILTGGTVFAQGIMVLALPILTRLYTPEDFNLLAVYSAVIGLVTVASCLRFNIAIPIPEGAPDALNLLVLALLSATGVAVLLALPVLFAPGWTAALLGQPDLQPYLWMIPIGVLFASQYDALQYWASRQKRFGLITRTRMTRAVGGAGTQLGLGAALITPFGLLFGHLLYSSLGAVALLRSMWTLDRTDFSGVTRQSLRQTAHRYRKFPTYSVPEALFNTSGIEIPIMILAAVAAGPEAGFLMLAMRVMGLPMGLVGSSVAQVSLAEAPAKLGDGTLVPFTRKTMWTLFKLGAPPLLAVGLVSPFVFPWIFGADWARAGVIVAWLTPWFIMQLVVSPVSMILHILDRLALAMVIQFGGAVLRIASLLAAWAFSPDMLTETFAISGFVFYLANLALLLAIIARASR